MSRRLAWAALLFVAVATPAAAQGSGFAKLIARLSEGGGYFQSDNLVSNEIAYLHVLDTFRERGVKGGAYIGVGPEQSFSYIAEIEPEIAYIIDIRRDNLLLHLLFKAMFAKARNRLEYLGLLYGRRMPDDLPMWTDLAITSLVDYIDRTPFDSTLHAANHEMLLAEVKKYRVPLSDEDRGVMRRFHDEFARSGLDLRYTNRGRGIRLTHPSARDLYLATDAQGQLGSYLATEDRWRAVRQLQQKHRVVPVVGNLAGSKALRAIGKHLEETNRTVSVFYISNVEQYLYRDGIYAAFVANVRALPAGPKSTLVRSRFGRGASMGAMSYGNGLTSQHAQSFERFLSLTAGADSSNYWGAISDSMPMPARP